MFPGPTARIYKNDAGEVIAWDYPSEPDPADAYDTYDDRGRGYYFYAKCPHCQTEDQFHEDELDGHYNVECHTCAEEFRPTDEELQS